MDLSIVGKHLVYGVSVVVYLALAVLLGKCLRGPQMGPMVSGVAEVEGKPDPAALDRIDQSESHPPELQPTADGRL